LPRRQRIDVGSAGIRAALQSIRGLNRGVQQAAPEIATPSAEVSSRAATDFFVGLTGTGEACLSDSMAQEARLLAALGATASRRIVGNALQLRDDRGTVRVRFKAPYLR
jgi:hypothetical protein